MSEKDEHQPADEQQPATGPENAGTIEIRMLDRIETIMNKSATG